MGNLIHKMPDSGTLQRTVLDQFRKVGNRGATVDEIAEAIRVLHQRVSPTVSSLKLIGFIGPKGQATRPSACGSQATVYVLTLDFTAELCSAGYHVRRSCQCKFLDCRHHEGEYCDAEATEVVETKAGSIRDMCLECAANVPSSSITASRSIGDKAK